VSIVTQIKGLSEDTVYYGFGGAFAKFISFFTAPILTRIFTPADYGMLDFVATTFSFFMMLAGINIVSGIYRFFYEVDKGKEQDKLLSTGLIFTMLMGIVFMGIMFSLKSIIGDYVRVQSGVDRDYSLFLTLVFLRAPFNLTQTYFLSMFRLQRKPKRYVVISILQVIINFVLIITFVVVLDMHLLGAFMADLVAIITITTITYLIYFRSIKFDFSRSLFIKAISYSLPQFPAVFINWGILQVNRLFLYEYCSETELGYFSIAFKISMVMQIAIMAFRSAWGPFSMQIMQKPDHKELYIKFYRLILIAFSLIGFIVFVFAKPILFIIAPPEYLPAFPMIVFIVFANAFDIAHQTIAIGIGIKKKTKYLSYAQGITFIFVLLFNYLFIKEYMALGAAYALFASYIVKAFFVYLFAQKLYPIKYELNNIIHFFIIFIISVFVSQFVYHRDMLSTIIVLISTAFIILSYVYFVWLRKVERDKIKSILISSYQTYLKR